MGWVWIKDTALDDAEYLRAGPLAGATYLRICMYLSRHKMGTFLPEACLPHVAVSRRWRPIRDSLVEHGFLLPVPGGYEVEFRIVKTSAQMPSAFRYQRMRDAPGGATPEQVAARIALYGGKCWICGTADYEAIDHVKPLAAGGSNWPANLRPACKPCNSSKGARWPFDRRTA